MEVPKYVAGASEERGKIFRNRMPRAHGGAKEECRSEAPTTLWVQANGCLFIWYPDFNLGDKRREASNKQPQTTRSGM